MIKADRVAVVRRTLEIIQQRGWVNKMSTDSASPLNVRSAIAAACTQLIGHAARREWYDGYLDAVHACNTVLKKGITYWEFDVKSPAEVEAMLIEVIDRLEKNAVRPRPSSRTRSRPSGV